MENKATAKDKNIKEEAGSQKGREQGPPESEGIPGLNTEGFLDFKISEEQFHQIVSILQKKPFEEVANCIGSLQVQYMRQKK